MLDYIKGKIVVINGDQIIVESGDNGFSFTLILLREEILNTGQYMQLFISKIINDFEDIDYAFINCDDRNMFTDLIRIKTVGPRTAITLLEVFGSDQLKKIIESNDIDRILEIKGIGTFTARLIINELSKRYFDIKLTQKQEKVINSLIKLGFKSKDIYQALREIKNSTDLEEMTRLTLERISTNESTRV